MKPFALLALAGITALLGSSSIAVAQAPPANVDDRFESMQAELEALRRDNQRMQSEISDLRSATDADWMTEERRAEIETLVSDILADADTRTSLADNGIIAGWSDHFFLASADDSFRLNIAGQMQFRLVTNYQDAGNRFLYGFENSRTKLGFSGHVYGPDNTFMVRGNFGPGNGGFLLEDAWMQFRLNNDWAIRAGQFKLPFNREELVDSSRQLAVERSNVNENMNFGRSQGVMLVHALDASKFMFAISDGIEDNVGPFGTLVGTSGGNTLALQEDVDWAVTVRNEWLVAGNWQQFADFTSPVTDTFGMLIGVAAHTQEEEDDIQTIVRERRFAAATADISVEWGGATFFTSGMWEYIDHPNFGQVQVWGFVTQFGWYLLDDVEAYVRWEHGWWDDRGFGFGDLNIYTFGTNWYIHGQNAKFTTDIGYADEEVNNNWDSDLTGWRQDLDGMRPQVVFRAQFQLLF